MKSRLFWIVGGGTALSLLACYGTLAIIAILGALGIAIGLNETLWAGAIVAFAVVAVGGLGLRLRQHQNLFPLALGFVGASTLVYTMYVQYDRIVELFGFVLLCIAAFWDWRLRQKQTG